MSHRGGAVATTALIVLILASARAGAQSVTSETISFAGGRVTLGGDVSATFSCTDSEISTSSVCADDTGFFNYTDYEHSALRMMRIDLTGSVRATNRLSFLVEVRSEDGGRLQPYALYARIRPWLSKPIDFQVGRVPPTFGAFIRSTYASDNLLIGYPLAYQYLMSIRADALPANADELLRMRGRGWLSTFSVGNTAPDRGLPLANAFRWDTGVQVHAAGRLVEGTMAVTTGSLGNPLVHDDNPGKQVAARVVARPLPGLVVGASGAVAPFVTRDAAASAGAANSISNLTQAAFGFDAEYSRDYYLVRMETIVSDWRVPLVQTPSIHLPLRAATILVEGRYKIRPGLYAAARFDHIGFSQISGTTRTAGWEAPVNRVEVGGGYSLLRNLLLKGAYQRDTRPAGRTQKINAIATQAVFWF
jgi:hypothetical protein